MDSSYIVNIILIAIGLLLLMSIAVILFFYFSRRKIIKAELEKANLEIEHQKDMLQSTIITQERERKRIAQDMHDAISSKLNVVSLNANLLTEDSISSEDVNKMGDTILKVTGMVLENSRRIAHDLLPPTLEKFGLVAALEELCDEFETSKKFRIEHSFQYDENFLEAEKELHLFRVAQELFNNAAKHSEATELILDLITNENILSLQYLDNGKGFDAIKAREAKGLGMSGIENRASILDAELQIHSEPGKGTKIDLNIPIQ